MAIVLRLCCDRNKKIIEHLKNVNVKPRNVVHASHALSLTIKI